MPFIPKLQQMFHCKSLSQLMDSHEKNRSKNGFMWIPADYKEMNHKLVGKWIRKFKYEPHSIRPGLAKYGMLPFSFMSTNHTFWPIWLIVYNIPPWMSVRKEHLMLNLIVTEKHQVKNMDIFLVPFIDEIQLLWKGIRMHEIWIPPSNRSFRLYGVLYWTIHDFPITGVCSRK